MKRRSILLGVGCVAGVAIPFAAVVYYRGWRQLSGGIETVRYTEARPGYTGSSQCRSCHQAFYRKWSTSHHGLAMQVYTAELGKAHLTAQPRPMRIGVYNYQADIEGGGWVIESGPGHKRRFRIDHVIGGKNVYYLLTPYERGRLQVLPIAYDVRKKEWFDTTASGVRMHPAFSREPLDWTDRRYTFNTSCYSCHVSQLATNYDLGSDTYRTRWTEPGINCEVCHAPGQAHLALFQQATGKIRPADLKIIRTTSFTPEQINATCAPCHAKMMPLSADFRPGDRYFDHYDLATL